MRTEKITALLAIALLLTALAVAGWLVHRGAHNDAQTAALRRSEQAAAVHDVLSTARSRELLLIARQLGNDKGFVGYIAQALQQGAGGAIDSASIRDLLDERRVEYGLDVAMLLDARGSTILDTASFQPTQSNLAQHPAVAHTLSTLETRGGYLRGRGRLMQFAVVPLLLGTSSEGLLLGGRYIEDAFLQDIGARTGADLALLTMTPAGPEIVAGTLDAGTRAALVTVATQRNWPATNVAPETVLLQLGSDSWLAQIRPLSDDRAAGSLIVLQPGATITAAVAQTDRHLLLGLGAVALLLLALIALLWRRLLQPLSALSQAAHGIAGGALEPVPAVGGGGVATIGRGLARLVGELREFRDFESYAADQLRQRTRASEAGPRAAPVVAIDHGAIAQFSAGTVFADRYQLYALVGAGPSGVVYRALDRRHGEVVALKLLGPGALADAAHANHVRELLRAGARVQHANVARIRDVGQLDGVIYVASEYVRGISLKDALGRTGRIPLYAALRLARQICAGLVAIHTAGTAHGALHPSNIVLAPGVDTKLLDIGLVARPPGFDHGDPTRPLRADPTYLSPQQIVGQLPNRQDDVYALGVILTEVFTAGLPQPNGSATELCLARVEREATPPSRLWTEIPAPIEALLLHCLERDPARRLPDAMAVLAVLERCRP